MDGTMPDGYEFCYSIYTEHCCQNPACLLGSECGCSLARYVRLGIIQKIESSCNSNNNTEMEDEYEMNGEMPEGYEPVGGYTEDCCGSSLCVLGSECKCSLATYVRLGILRRKAGAD